MACHPILTALASRRLVDAAKDIAANELGSSRRYDLIPIAQAVVVDPCGFILRDLASHRHVSLDRRGTLTGGSPAVLRLTYHGEQELTGTLKVTALLADDMERVVTIEEAQISGGEEAVWVLASADGWSWGDARMAWVEFVVG